MELGAVAITILLCLGAAQGIFYGVVLYKSESVNKTANRFLAAILFFLSYLLIVQILRLFGLGFYDFWYHILLDYSWINGALLFFYVKALLQPDFKLERKDWIHFLPVLIQVVCSVFVRSQSFYWDGTHESLSRLGYWGYVVWMNYSTVNMVASLLIVIYALKAQQLLTKAYKTGEAKPEASIWIRRVLWAFILFFALVLLVLLADLIWFNTLTNRSYFYFMRFYFYPYFIGLSGLTYWLGFEGYGRKDQQAFEAKVILSATEQEQLEAIADQLIKLMVEEKTYKNQELSLGALAEILNIKPYLLSKCLKLVFKQKFNDYINSFRIAEVKRLLADPANSHYTLLSLALDAGFNSKSSFNRAVLKQEGVTPSELKRNL